MYDFIDRPVTDLDHGGRLIVWSMRNWVKAVAERKCPAGSVACAFDRWNAMPGLQPFLQAMALFNRHGLEKFNFCALPCNHVSEHEAIIISLVCSAHSGPMDEVRQTLSLLVEKSAVDDLAVTIARLSQALAEAGIHPARASVSRTADPETPLS